LRISAQTEIKVLTEQEKVGWSVDSSSINQMAGLAFCLQIGTSAGNSVLADAEQTKLN
jgi:hypothetical protein